MLGEQRALEELVALSSAASQSVDAQDVAGGIQDLKKELKDPEEAAAVNLPSFNRKLEILQRQIVDETEKIVVRESDRIIESVIAGPHDRLLDKVGAAAGSAHSDVAYRSSLRISMLSGRKWCVSYECGCSALARLFFRAGAVASRLDTSCWRCATTTTIARRSASGKRRCSKARMSMTQTHGAWSSSPLRD